MLPTPNPRTTILCITHHSSASVVSATLAAIATALAKSAWQTLPRSWAKNIASNGNVHSYQTKLQIKSVSYQNMVAHVTKHQLLVLVLATRLVTSSPTCGKQGWKKSLGILRRQNRRTALFELMTQPSTWAQTRKDSNGVQSDINTTGCRLCKRLYAPAWHTAVPGMKKELKGI